MGKLGYSSMTLTDLTETIPVTLFLETNQNKNVQTKDGELYIPNFVNPNPDRLEKELIVTPSLFIGNTEVNLEEYSEYIKPQDRGSGFIYYNIGKLNNDNVECKYYFGSPENTGTIYVDDLGQLHIKENLTETLIIEAFIEDFHNEKHNYTIDLVNTTNPITFLFLEEAKGKYSVIMFFIMEIFDKSFNDQSLC